MFLSINKQLTMNGINNKKHRKETDLSKYPVGELTADVSKTKRTLWFFVNSIFLQSSFFPMMGFKKWLLRKFGARIGKRVFIKPSVNIKYPWNLTIGDDTWIGEKVWIDNLDMVTIGNNVCISQDSMLMCGNHNYKKSTFDLMVGNITIEDGVWVGAKCLVCPGVTLHSHSVLVVGSVASTNLDAYSIYRGNPAVKVKNRIIE